ncbi:hypothetical protein QOM21_33805 [Streptomyces sp. Pv4-95]|uniref:hypothetical protein n=1 Tax=Streptomyces sp. Pv4-95 TaxID=3049543 RepID=UPI0038925102
MRLPDQVKRLLTLGDSRHFVPGENDKPPAADQPQERTRPTDTKRRKRSDAAHR